MEIGMFCLLFFLLLPSVTSAHGGRTDSYGGHNKNVNSTYHCHSGQCLEDSWKMANNEFYPIGLEDGHIRNDQSSDISEFIRKEYDSDQAEYMVSYALKAYKIGYEETYVPTFREKYQWYIGGLSALTLLLSGVAVFGLRKLSARRKKNNVYG